MGVAALNPSYGSPTEPRYTSAFKVDLSGLARENRTTTDLGRRRELGIYGRWCNVAGVVRVDGSPIQRRIRREAQSTQRG